MSLINISVHLLTCEEGQERAGEMTLDTRAGVTFNEGQEILQNLFSSLSRKRTYIRTIILLNGRSQSKTQASEGIESRKINTRMN